MRVHAWGLLLVLLSTAAVAKTSFRIGVESFPRIIHARYVMQYTRTRDDGTSPTKWTEVTTLQSVKGDLLTFVVQETRDGEPQPPESYFAVLRGDAMFVGLNEPRLIDADVHAIAGMSLVFKFPLRDGLTWQLSPDGSARRTVEGREQVDVPAGRYEAIKIHEVRDGGGGTSWYVPSIGVVKADMQASHSRIVKALVRYETP